MSIFALIRVLSDTVIYTWCLTCSVKLQVLVMVFWSFTQDTSTFSRVTCKSPQQNEHVLIHKQTCLSMNPPCCVFVFISKLPCIEGKQLNKALPLTLANRILQRWERMQRNCCQVTEISPGVGVLNRRKTLWRNINFVFHVFEFTNCFFPLFKQNWCNRLSHDHDYIVNWCWLMFSRFKSLQAHTVQVVAKTDTRTSWRKQVFLHQWFWTTFHE